MNDISNEQKLEFAHKEFPGKAVNLGDGNWWYIQAGTLMGEDLHYEYHNGKVHLHIEGSVLSVAKRCIMAATKTQLKAMLMHER